MDITVANGSGFCFGVRLAYEILDGVLKNKRESDRVFTLGSFVHNNWGWKNSAASNRVTLPIW